MHFDEVPLTEETLTSFRGKLETQRNYVEGKLVTCFL